MGNLFKRFMILAICFILGIAPMLTNAENCEKGLHVYFLDVGQGDAAVILCDGQALMIDGGDAKYSSFIYSFLRNTLQLDEIEIMIASHPHADHAGGLAAALNACPVGALYTPVIDYETGAWPSDDMKSHTFKHNYYFTFGDNSINSRDSRYWGFLPEEFIIGIVGGKRVRNKPDQTIIETP